MRQEYVNRVKNLNEERDALVCQLICIYPLVFQAVVEIGLAMSYFKQVVFNEKCTACACVSIGRGLISLCIVL